ncbi:MAG: HPr family phosphocarrier protein [Proteobacteria bacterium]|nr:HPr family phosphocarrier protein [Pseudomonadota bacterium]
MLVEEIEITNKLGLHLRAATKLVQLASEFEAAITISCNEQFADAKSIMDVLMLAAIVGTIVKIEVSGDNSEEEQDIINQLVALFQDKFGEDE